MKKKKYTKFKTLYSSSNSRNIDKFMEKLKDVEGVSIYRRNFQGKDKTKFYVRKVVRQGTKVQ